MTTPISIVDGPEGLPDLNALARLATAYFQAPPGSSPILDAGAAAPVDTTPAARPATAPAQSAKPVTAPVLPQGAAAVSGVSDYYFLNDRSVSAPDSGRLAEPRGPADPAPFSGTPGVYQVRAPQRDLLEQRPQRREAQSSHLWVNGSERFDVQAVRRDFPILAQRVDGRPLIWLDNAATTQKPRAVIERLSCFYETENSNIHRAAHALAARATDAYEDARSCVAGFIGAASPDEIIFVRGTTEGINLLANTLGRSRVGSGDEILISHLEHHANIVPWQMLAQSVGARLRVIPVDEDGQIRFAEFLSLLNPRTRLVSITQVSNALGTIVPVAQVIAAAHAAGVPVIVDAAQSVSHMAVDVRALDADFLVFSGHKIFGPTGIGVVYGKAEHLHHLRPWQGGGNMIRDVTFEHTEYQDAPARFEAGTGNIADAVGLGAALRYVRGIGLDAIGRYEHELLVYGTDELRRIPGVRLIGTAPDKASVLSFVLDGVDTEAVGRALSQEGIAVRSGHHCAQPILRHYGLEATVRPSLAFYNTPQEVDALVSVVRRLARWR